jgi:hypothetical protein
MIYVKKEGLIFLGSLMSKARSGGAPDGGFADGWIDCRQG